MKRKVKKMAGGGYGRFTEDSPKSVEDMKSGIAAGAPAADEDTGMRPGKNLASEPDSAPAPSKPRTKTGSGASGFPLKEKEKAEKPVRVSSGASGFPLKKKEKAPYEGFKKGGSASSRADGCAQRGKTRGKMY